MRLHEYQAKRILSRFGVPVPRGRVASSLSEVRQTMEWLGARAVLKAQVLTGGRGRAGGIRLANDARAAEDVAARMFGMEIHGYTASRILVDEAIEIDQEIYVAVTIDRTGHVAGVEGTGWPIVVASATGGVEIDSVASEAPEQVLRFPVDPLLGLRAYQVRALAYEIGLGREQARRFVSVAQGLWRAFATYEATLVEANPLVVTPAGEMYSLNVRMIVDDNALFRHAELRDMRDESQETAAERLARRYGVHYVRLGGHVGCVSNGAGLAMATLDLLRTHGVKAANFVDIGVAASPERVWAGLRLALSNSIRAVLINVFGGVTRCDRVARDILAAADVVPGGVPVVVRMEGTNCREGRDLLEQGAAEQGLRLYLAGTAEDAVRQVRSLVSADVDRCGGGAVSILVDQGTRILVHGIRGRLGLVYTERMLACSTPVVAGVAYGLGGMWLSGVPVFDTVEEAVRATDANAALICTPADGVADAVLESADANLPLIVCVTA